jgi:hypothetical protein
VAPAYIKATSQIDQTTSRFDKKWLLRFAETTNSKSFKLWASCLIERLQTLAMRKMRLNSLMIHVKIGTRVGNIESATNESGEPTYFGYG